MLNLVKGSVCVWRSSGPSDVESKNGPRPKRVSNVFRMTERNGKTDAPIIIVKRVISHVSSTYIISTITFLPLLFIFFRFLLGPHRRKAAAEILSKNTRTISPAIRDSNFATVYYSKFRWWSFWEYLKKVNRLPIFPFCSWFDKGLVQLSRPVCVPGRF